MRQVTKEELSKILELHKAFLDSFGERGARADLRNADLRNVDLRNANLRNANLRSADLYGANLYGANLYGADLYGADLRSADLYGADLRSANLESADLRSANLYGANLYGADLYGADLYGADLLDSILQFGPIGSRKDYTVVNVTLDSVQCGCFSGSLEEFKSKVRETYQEGHKHRVEYDAVITFVTAVKASL